MIFPKTNSAAFSLALSISAFKTLPAIAAEDSCTSIDYITCIKTASPPTVEVFESPLTGALTSKMYSAGNMKIQCVYDATDIYFLYQIPGKYMFDITDNKKCASVASMFQMGEKATFFNMRGYPLSEAVNCTAVPEGCAPYTVDIGAHRELKTTERGNEGTGNDLIVNKDDEFAIGPYCRVDDNFGTSPGNEWSGAWGFTGNATDGAEGYYIFETSSSLTTPSPETDIQLTPGRGQLWSFLLAGWTDTGHVVAGCSEDWVGLSLVDENGDATPVFDDVGGEEESAEPKESGSDMETASTPAPSGTAYISSIVGAAYTFAAAAVATYVMFETLKVIIHSTTSTMKIRAFALPLSLLCGTTVSMAAMSNSTSSSSPHSMADMAGLSLSDDDSSEEGERRAPRANTVPPHMGHKKVLVTGGAGFVGSNVAEQLLARGDDVVIVDEMNDYYDLRIKENNLQRLREMYPEDKRLAIYRGDICDEDFMLQLFEKERPQWVCHMAARAGVRPSIQDPFVYIHSNIRGTTHLMELSHKFGVKNFVFASSSSVYGGSKSTFFSEDENVDNPVSPYAASKKACELLAYTYHHLYNLNVSGLRFFTVYGPRGRPDMAPFKFIDRVSRGLELQQFGDGSSSRDYTYIDDIVDGVLRAIDRPHKYEMFNLGKGSGTSLKEFLDIVQSHVGKKAIIKIMPDQPGDVPYTCADVSKAYDLLGYRATVPFSEGIRRTVDWYMNDYGKNSCIEPETQANGMGRAPSFAEIREAVNA